MPDGASINQGPKVTAPFKRPDFPGRPQIEGTMHKAMEQGRMVESALGDAIFIVQDAKRNMLQRITHYVLMQMGGVDTYLPDKVRPMKLATTVAKWIQQAREYIQEVMAIVQALMQCIGWLQMILNNIRAFIQNIMNMIATLLNEICNLGLPDLPALPNIFGLFKFDGFQFAALKGAFNFKLSFDTNFAFKQCNIHKPNTDIFRNYPKTLDLGGGLVLTMPGPSRPRLGDRVDVGTLQSVIDSGGNTAGLPPDMQMKFNSTSVPFFTPDYDVDRDVYGSFPDPNQIVSNYEISPADYGRNVLSLVPTPDTISWGHGATEPNPFVDGARSISNMLDPRSQALMDLKLAAVDNLREKINHIRQDIRAFSVAAINLEAGVDSNYNAHIFAAWIEYLYRCRYESPTHELGRGGKWVPRFQEVFDEFIVPSYNVLIATPVKWHVGINGNLQAMPDDLPLVVQLKQWKQSNDPRWGQLLYMLSYVEASLLGYNRSTRWDSYKAKQSTDMDAQVQAYLQWVTTSNLDLAPTAIDDSLMLDVVLDGGGLAQWPSKISVPANIVTRVQDLVNKCTKDVARRSGELATVFTSDEVENKWRYTYNIHAESTVVDKYSAYFRQFAANWQRFMDPNQTDVRVRAVTQSYQLAIDSAVNPLAEALGIADIFLWIREDTLNKNASWIPGTPALPAPDPLAESTTKPYSLLDGPGPSDPTGWAQSPNNYMAFTPAPWTNPANPPAAPGLFNAEEFISRPDVQALPLNVQLKMLQLNQAAAAVAQTLAETESTITSKMNAVQADVDDGLMQIADLSAKIDSIETQSAAILDDIANGGDGTGGTGTGGGSTGGGVTSTTPSYRTTIGGTDLIFNVNHNLGKKYPIVQFYDTATGEVVYCDFAAVDTNTIQVVLLTPVAAGAIEVVVIA